MQSVLIKFASAAVMLHMSFGCSWHHGLGTDACAGQCSTIACNHDGQESYGCDHEHEDHGHDHKQPLEPKSTTQDDCGSLGHSHFGCQDDSCKVTQFVKFAFLPLDFSTPYLGGADNFALIDCQARAGIALDPFPDDSRTETAVRAHLLLGVQIL